jgi:PAS domain S-box-containing protein
MMRGRRRLTALMLLMMGVAMVVGMSAIYVIYQGSLERERVRLQDLVYSQARVLEALARLDQTHAGDPQGPVPGSLRQFIEIHRSVRLRGLGTSGEIVLARRVGDHIDFLLRQGGADPYQPLSIPFDSPLAAPMRAALNGQSGTLIGLDYHGHLVLAAYEPVATLNLGFVAKTNVAEIRQRFTQAALSLLLIGLITVLGAGGFFFWITERAEQSLMDSEVRFRSTFENAAVGIALVGIDGSWLRVNQRLCEIVGYPHDELVHKTFQDITHPDDLPADLDQFGQLVRGEIPSYRLQKRYNHKAGHSVWINLTRALQRDAAGHPLYCISIVEDISQRKQAEQALHESETRMRALLDASEDEILLVSTAGRVLAINQTAERRLAHRIAGGEPVGAALTELLPLDRAQARLAAVRDVATSGQRVHQELAIGRRWFEFWFYPVRHTEQPIAEVALYAREITEQRRVADELRRLYQAIQHSPVSVIITDPQGLIVYVNPKFSAVTGYAHDEVIGRNPRILKSGHTPQDDYQQLWDTIRSGRIWRGEFHNRKKNGELFWEIAAIGPVKNDAGEIINYVAVKEDVTERRAVEEQLRQAQKMQAIGQLTGGIAHDFNNLLTIIVGNLQLLEQGLGNDDRHRILISDALWAAWRGGELIHRLLAFARLQPLKPRIINVNDCVRGLADLLSRTLGSNIAVVEDLAPDLPPVLADPGELERALVNLALNARDAMPQGGQVTVQTRQTPLEADIIERSTPETCGEYVLLAISDTGTGIPAPLLERIFEPFFTTKAVGQGSGLGLSMVYGFVKQSGGHIRVHSTVGAGTTFKLFFPQSGAARTPLLACQPNVSADSMNRGGLGSSNGTLPAHALPLGREGDLSL